MQNKFLENSWADFLNAVSFYENALGKSHFRGLVTGKENPTYELIEMRVHQLLQKEVIGLHDSWEPLAYSRHISHIVALAEILGSFRLKQNKGYLRLQAFLENLDETSEIPEPEKEEFTDLSLEDAQLVELATIKGILWEYGYGLPVTIASKGSIAVGDRANSGFPLLPFEVLGKDGQFWKLKFETGVEGFAVVKTQAEGRSLAQANIDIHADDLGDTRDLSDLDIDDDCYELEWDFHTALVAKAFPGSEPDQLDAIDDDRPEYQVVSAMVWQDNPVDEVFLAISLFEEPLTCNIVFVCENPAHVPVVEAFFESKVKEAVVASAWTAKISQ